MNVDWANLSVGVASILGLIYVVREIRGMTRDNNAALLGQATVMREIAVALGILNEKTDRLHDDNVEQAAALKSADDSKTRKVEEQAPNGNGKK